MKIEPRGPAELMLSEAKRGAERPTDELIVAIFKVDKADYVPREVRVRSRINANMFTGELKGAFLEQVEKDTNVVSISFSKELKIID